MNEKKEKIKKFFRDHSDGLITTSIAIVGITLSTSASYVTVKRSMGKFAISDIEHDEKCTGPIWITYKNGNTETWHPRAKKIDV